MSAKWRQAWTLLKDTFEEWRQDDALQWGAALAYYAVFSIAPILLIGIAAAGLLFGAQDVRERVLEQVEGLAGTRGAEMLDQMVANSAAGGGTWWAATLGVVMLLVGATTVFAQLKVAMNRMWDVRSSVRGVRGFLRKRLLAFAMVAAVGFLLLVSMLFSAALSYVDDWMGSLGGMPVWMLRLASEVVSLGIVTLLFAFIFKVLPDVRIRWRDVWWGALFTALLFTAGKWAMGLYIGNSRVATGYGAAGALVVLLLWVFYSSQILLIGAEFTQVHARRRGTGFEPTHDAVRIA